MPNQFTGKIRVHVEEKTCRTCLLVKPINDFYKSEHMCDGRISYCKKCMIVRTGEYYKKNKEKMKKWDKSHYELRKIDPDYRERKSAYQKKRVDSDPIFRARKNIGCRINNALRRSGLTKTNKTHHLLGCTPRQAVYFLTGGGNEIPNGLHVDHHVPCSFFDLSIIAHQMVCFNWRNLRLLPKTENLIKSDSLPPDYREHLNGICEAISINSNVFDIK